MTQNYGVTAVVLDSTSNYVIIRFSFIKEIKSMRMFLAILACKVSKCLLKLIGRGSSLPGDIALKICPDVLSRVKLPEQVIAVTGSNGKTSTVEMIAQIMRKSGKKVIWNKEGSNQIAGVTAIILSNCTFGGKVKGDVLLLESDERYAKYSFKFFAPTHYIITNLYRDQLTRNGHPEWVYESVKESIRPESQLILNADDPLVSRYGRDRDNVIWFGMDKQDFSTDHATGVYNDGAFCPECKHRMSYDYYHYAHIGSYHCDNCGHKKHDTQYTVTNVDYDSGIVTINGKYKIKLLFKSVYNVYNILACFAACSIVGIDGDVIADELSHYFLKSGRILQFKLGMNKGTFLIAKHENSVASDRVYDYIIRKNQPCSVIIIIDSVSRRYSTGETSWLWDIDYGVLKADCIQHLYLLGRHAKDLETRLSYTDIDMGKVTVNEDIPAALDEIAAKPLGKLYTVTCFSDKEKFFSNDNWEERSRKKKWKRFYQVRNSTYLNHHYGRNWWVRYLRGFNGMLGYLLVALFTCPFKNVYTLNDVAKFWQAYRDGIHEKLGRY